MPNVALSSSEHHHCAMLTTIYNKTDMLYKIIELPLKEEFTQKCKCSHFLLYNISNDLDRWTALPLSLLGRVECTLMNVLPRLLHLFQMLPLEIPKSTFKKSDRLFSRFIWQRKRPRVRLKTLQKGRRTGTPKS